MRPPRPQATVPKSQPWRRRRQALLPACTTRVCAPIALHRRISANPPPPAPNTLPSCVPRHNQGAILAPQPRETPPPSRSESQAACSQSASILLRCLQSTFSRWGIPAHGPLPRKRHAPLRISPPVLFPFPGIAKPVPEKQTLLFPYFFPVFT